MNSPARNLGWLVVLLVGVLLFHPAATPVHVEGFSASIVSLGLHLREGALSTYDVVFPVNLEFFALSRLGVVAGVAITSLLTGVGGDGAMRMIMWLGSLLLTASTLICARQWGSVSWISAAVAILLVPGAMENSFFFNDNVPAAALLAAGFAALSIPGRALWRSVLAGVLLGAAVVCRFDAMLAAVAAPLIIVVRHDDLREKVMQLTLVGAAACAVMIGVPAVFDRTLVDTIGISTYVIGIWHRPSSLLKHMAEALVFVGLPGMLLSAAAVLTLVRTRQHSTLLLLLVPIVVVNVVSGGKLWQSRQLLTLAPFVCTLVAVELEHLYQRWRQDRSSGAILGLPALALLIAAFAGPHIGWVSDGPRSITGRLRALPAWRSWQQDVQRDFRLIQAEIAGSDTLLIITDDWDADRFVHLTLQQSGHNALMRVHPDLNCRQVELFQKNDRLVYHLRLHIPFVPRSLTLAQYRFAEDGRECSLVLGTQRTILVGRPGSSHRLFQEMRVANPDSLILAGRTSPKFYAIDLDRTLLTNGNSALNDTSSSESARERKRSLALADSLLAPPWLTTRLRKHSGGDSVW